MADAAAAAGAAGAAILRPGAWLPGPPAEWERPGFRAPASLLVDDVRQVLRRRDERAVEPPALPSSGGGDGDEVAPRRAAVLCALFDEGIQAQVLLTRRSSKLRSHTGQVSFPGGRVEPGESALQAALREAHEEVGIDPSTVELLGRLSKHTTLVDGAPITPFVCALPERPLLRPSPAEVERAFTVGLLDLMEPSVHRTELWVVPGQPRRPIHFFELDGETIWGATARMLSELLELIVDFGLGDLPSPEGA